MTKREIDDVNNIIFRLENHKVVNSQDFAQNYMKLVGEKFVGTRCVPCIKAAIKKMRTALSTITCSDCPKKIEPVVEPIVEPVKELKELSSELKKINNKNINKKPKIEDKKIDNNNG